MKLCIDLNPLLNSSLGVISHADKFILFNVVTHTYIAL